MLFSYEELIKRRKEQQKMASVIANQAIVSPYRPDASLEIAKAVNRLTVAVLLAADLLPYTEEESE